MVVVAIVADQQDFLHGRVREDMSLQGIPF